MWTAENRGRYNRDHPRYPSDLTDAEWIEIAPLIAPARGGGRRREVDVRNLVNGVMNVLSTGCQWRYIPRIRTNAGIAARLGSIEYNILRCTQSDAIPRDRSATALGGLISACTAAAEEALLQRDQTCRSPACKGPQKTVH
jgi:transposase